MLNTLASDANVEPGWKTYLKGAGFLLPALIFWEVVCFKCVPILVAIVQNSGARLGSAEGFWNFSMFVVRHGLLIFAALIVAFVVFELFSRAGNRYRRRAVGGAVWLLNSIVICGLAALFTVTLIVFPNLLK
jgi:type II secretory pathway component PulF